MWYPSLDRVLNVQHRLLDSSGGIHGLRSPELLDSAFHQPLATFGGEDLYPSIIDKASALAFFLIRNHPFLDGNKRIGHAMLEDMLLMNEYELLPDVDDQERMILSLAEGVVSLAAFT